MIPISTGTLNSALVVGDVALEPALHSARMDGRLVHLTRKEYALLQCLVLHKGRVVPRGTLLTSVWGVEANYGLRTVDVYIRRLRVKLAQSIHCRVETVVNVGYKLVVDMG